MLSSVAFYLYIALSIATLIASTPVMILAQNSTSSNSSGIVNELREIKALLEKESSPSSWASMINAVLTFSSIAATISVAYVIFLLDQRSRRKSIIRRACKTLERELKQAIESFGTGKRIHGSYYKESPGQDPVIREFDYNSSIIITDSYESILHSAFFTELHTDTQDLLSTLYDRIRTHNRLVLSIGQFEKPTPKMFEYQVYLTEREPQIITLLHRSQEKVRFELVALTQSRLKKAFRLKGNPDH
jgi:hypothetical protein